MNRSYQFLVAPFALLKRQHLAYLTYLSIVFGTLALVAPYLYGLLLDQSARLFAERMIPLEQLGLLRRFIGGFVLTLTLPVVITALTLPYRGESPSSWRTITGLLRQTPRGCAYAGAALIALFFRSFRLWIPLFFIFLAYLIIEEQLQLGDREFFWTILGTSALFAPYIWRSGTLLVAPTLAVLGNIGGRTVLAECSRTMRGKEYEIWILILGCAATPLSIQALLKTMSLEIPPPTVYLTIGSTAWFLLSALGALVAQAPNSGTPQP